MTRASLAAARLPRVKQLAEERGPALKQAFALLQSGALVGPAGTRLQQTLVRAHDDARSGFYAAFDAVHHLAGEDGPPPRIGEPYIPGPPRGRPPGSPAERSGSPAGLDQLGRALSSAAESWNDAAATLSRILADLGLSTAPVRSISRSANHVRALKPDVDRRRAELLKTDQQQIVQSAVKTIQGILPKSPGVKEAIGSLWDTYAHRYLPGVWEGAKDIGLGGLAINPFSAPFYFGINRKSWMERGPVGQIKGLFLGVQHPGEFAKAIVNWEDWKRDPVHALGKTAPSIAITAATMGTGSGAGVGSKIGAALRNAARKGTKPDLETAVRADPAPPRQPSNSDHPGSHFDDERASAAAPVLSEKALSALRNVEDAAQRIAARFGVKVDFSSHPIDPANARGITEALEGAANDYPSIFRDMKNVKVQSLDEMRKTNPSAGPNTMAHSINDGSGPGPQGIYLNQTNLMSKAVTDAVAIKRTEEGWSVPKGLTARGTFYHEFGHQIGHRILADPRLCQELARELRKVGVSVDEFSLQVGVPFGQQRLAAGLGEYGTTNASEMIAEGFAEWRLNAHSRPISATIGQFIDKHFKGK
ncbi:hypothetical protein HUT06_27480 [Actinomadura sp. NAK00032]|uniref:hypothetical protein n=1 Tax=Actinomadura sp. NAK00032 TaxID=2742128 RepID=UPI0015900996|nr:hypothetical protein [Actinomadura sp. NAK00032]QKW37291.1 hypothetical protein HUT06_27480 [Actinomadura sp. NAK00032]